MRIHATMRTIESRSGSFVLQPRLQPLRGASFSDNEGKDEPWPRIYRCLASSQELHGEHPSNGWRVVQHSELENSAGSV